MDIDVFEAPPAFDAAAEALLQAAARDFHDERLNDAFRATQARMVSPALARRILGSAITNGDHVGDEMLDACERAITTGESVSVSRWA